MSTKLAEVVLDLSEEEELLLYRTAHKQNITVNQLVEIILLRAIEDIEGKRQLSFPFYE